MQSAAKASAHCPLPTGLFLVSIHLNELEILEKPCTTTGRQPNTIVFLIYYQNNTAINPCFLLFKSTIISDIHPDNIGYVKEHFL